MSRALRLAVAFAGIAVAARLLLGDAPGPSAPPPSREPLPEQPTPPAPPHGAGPERLAVEPQDLEREAPVVDVEAPSAAAPIALRLRLVARGTERGLGGYRVRVVPAGADPVRAATWDAAAATDSDGFLTLPVPDARVHVEVHAMPMASVAAFDALIRPERLATLPPTELELDRLHVLPVSVGPRVVYRGPLPAGVAASDLRFELRARISPFSSQAGGDGGFAQGAADTEGHVSAYVPPVTVLAQEPLHDLRIWTADGLWGHRSAHAGVLRNDAVVTVDDPLVPRARFELDVEVLGEASDPPSAVELARSIAWTVLEGDPERDGLGGPGTDFRARFPEPVGPGRVRFGDLPVGSTIEFEGPSPRASWTDRFELVENPNRLVTSRGAPARGVLRVRAR